MQQEAVLRARRLARHLPPSVRETLKRPAREERPPDGVSPGFREFAATRAGELRGDVLVAAGLERLVGGRAYVLDADVRRGETTVVADLAEPGSLPPERFDAIVLPGLDADAVANAWRALRPGGLLLASGDASGLGSAVRVEGDCFSAVKA